MLTLKIIGNDGNLMGVWKGLSINAEYSGDLLPGDIIRVFADGCSFVSMKLEPSFSESIVWLPNNRFEFVIPPESQRGMCYHPDAFLGDTHIISVREPDDDEVYGYRNIALNSHDCHGVDR